MAQDIGENPRGRGANEPKRACSKREMRQPCAQGCYGKQSCSGWQFKEQRVSQRYTNKRKLACSLVALLRSFAVMATPPPPFGATYAHFS